ncbi:MAG: hypothetical protein QNJ37_08745 [Crocosphaera sp.]|nr:hypothetical protein [Crocosphaera sp.]
MNRKQWIKFTLLCLLGTLVIVNLHSGFFKPSIQAREPGRTQPCLPKVDQQNVFEIEEIGFTDHQNKRYYLFSVLRNQPVPPFDDWFYQDTTYTLVSVDKIGCLVEVTTSNYFQSTLEKYVPQEVARQIALIKLKAITEKAGGVEAYIKQRNESNFGEDYGKPWLLFPEDVWAWEKLAGKLPEPYLIIKNLSEVYDETYSPMYE